MRWNPPASKIEKKSGAPTYGTSVVRRGTVAYNDNWSTERAVCEALDRVTWVFRCVDAIASNAARQEIVIRENNPWDGEVVSDPELYSLLNSKTNEGEAAIIFRYRLSAQLLLSKKGVFINVVRNNAGDVIEMFLLPPDSMEPIKDSKTLVKGWKLSTTDANGRPSEKKFKPEDIIWIRRPHPFDPYKALTPLEAAGLAIETDWLAKMYNRNFLLNDGRPGGMVVIKGDMMEEDKEELRARFSGGVARAGRISVIASDQGADFVDTAVTPRDAQYTESRQSTKDEILLGFGVPESVLANASGRCVDEATEALTQRGWVNGRDLTTDDVILSADPADGKLKWGPVREVYRNENYSGDMYRIKHSHADFLVTPGHNWLTHSKDEAAENPFRLVKVEDLVEKDRILTIGTAEDENQESEFSDAFVELVGWAVTEGYYYPNDWSRENRPGKTAPYVRISQNAGDHSDRIERCLKEAGAAFSITERFESERTESNNLFNVRGEIAAAILQVSPERVMTQDFILALTSDQRNLLLQTIIDGDGCRQQTTSSWTFAQKDPLATEAFVFLATLCGYTTSTIDEEFDYTHKGVTVKATRRRAIVRQRTTMTIQRGARTVEHYEGLVWCPRTDYGTFVSRRDGRVVLTGNTFDNAEVERLVFWQETMLPHLDLTYRPMDDLDNNDEHFLSVNLARVDVLQRMEMKRREFLLREYDAGATDVNEYRVSTGREEIPGEWGKVHWISKNKKMASMTDGSEFPEPVAQDVAKPTAGQPESQDVNEAPEEDPNAREDDRQPALPNTETTPEAQGPASEGKKEIDQSFMSEVLADYDLYGELASNVIERLSERVARVVKQKVGGPKFRSAMYKDAGADELLDVAFSDDTWTTQLLEDLAPIARGAWKDANQKYALKLGVETTEPDVKVSSMFVYQLKVLVGDLIETFVKAGGGSADDLSAELSEAISSYMTGDKAREYAKNVVIQAYNEGIDAACSEADCKKMWVKLADSPGQNRLNGEIANGTGFKLGRKTIRVPSGTLAKAVIIPVLNDVPVI